MMYKNMFVAAIKVDGKVCREIGETIRIPLGSEYQIFFKNLNTLDAMVHVTIDGKSVTADGLVVSAQSECTIERPATAGSGGNKFKFIAMTDQIADHRGIEAEDGLISIKFQFAKYPKQVFKPVDWTDYLSSKKPGVPYYHRGSWELGQVATPTFGGICGSTGDKYGNVSYSTCDVHVPNEVASARSATMDCAFINASSQSDVAGITVPGSLSTQQFVHVADFPLQDEVHVMVFRMSGFVDEKSTVQIKKAFTVEVKKYCPTCGRKAKPADKFCSNCATSLEQVKD